jgi:methylase of polypeptide subunit release factors
VDAPDAPRTPTPAEAAALRADLEAAGYTVDGVEELLGPVAAAALSREQALPARRALRGRREPTAVLARAFVLGEQVPRGLLDAALPTTGSERLAALGLVDVAGAGPDDPVRARVDLRPYAATDAAGSAEWWVASDLGELATGAALRTDHVLGIGGASTTLAQITVREPTGRVLDLGTGCGVQALHAARHAEHVVGTDVSRRALAFAAFNAALAGVDLDLREGSLLEPVAGERFDLVVSNPPFVITPRSAAVPGYEYRDAGLAGDEVVRRLVRGVAGVLAPGGIAQLLGNWEHLRGVPWQQRVGAWLEGTGLDAWVVQREVSDPAEYAETWIRDGGQPAGPAFDAIEEAWLDDFAARGVEAVGFGYVLLRRPATGTPTLRRLEERPGPVHQPLGGHLAACLRTHDLLAGADDAALLAARWRVADDVTEERHHTPGQGDPAVVLLRQNTGFGTVVRAGTVLAAAVGACDGELPLGVIADAVAALCDAPADAVRAEVAAGVRELAADGLVAPLQHPA